MGISTLIRETVLAFLKRNGCLYEGETNHIIPLRTPIQVPLKRSHTLSDSLPLVLFAVLLCSILTSWRILFPINPSPSCLRVLSNFSFVGTYCPRGSGRA